MIAIPQRTPEPFLHVIRSRKFLIFDRHSHRSQQSLGHDISYLQNFHKTKRQSSSVLSVRKQPKISRLCDYTLLSFDFYGTLIGWETGILEALKPLTEQKDLNREQILGTYHELEKDQQTKTPDMPYSELCTTIYPKIVERFLGSASTAQEAEAFGQSVGRWPAFPDTVDALKRLSKHYKLVLLSNVDNESFKISNAGTLQGFPFDRVITAQEVGSYKPDLRNFEYMLKTAKGEFGIDKSQVLQTAQSQFHDHHPAKKTGIASVWISRSATMGNREEEIYDWKFTTLGEMADSVEKELAAQ